MPNRKDIWVFLKNALHFYFVKFKKIYFYCTFMFLFRNILAAVWKKEFWSAVPALALYCKWFLGGKQVPIQTSKLDCFVPGHLRIFILQHRESITEVSKSQKEKLLLKSFSESFSFILGKWKCAQWLHRAELLWDTGLLTSLKKWHHYEDKK